MFTSLFDMSSLGNKPQLKEGAPGNLWAVCPGCRRRTGKGGGRGLWASSTQPGDGGPCGAGGWPGVPVWALVPAQPLAAWGLSAEL